MAFSSELFPVLYMIITVVISTNTLFGFALQRHPTIGVQCRVSLCFAY